MLMQRSWTQSPKWIIDSELQRKGVLNMRSVCQFTIHSALVLIFAMTMPALAASYKYTDTYGITFWVDDQNKIPVEYRNQERKLPPKNQPEPAPVSKMEKPKRYTKVTIANNQIIVRVILVNKGQRTAANMILDTGGYQHHHLSRPCQKTGPDRQYDINGIQQNS